MARAASSEKVIHLVRHGQTEMNVYLHENNWADPNFKDPLLWDTRLTSRGQQQAQSLSTVTSTLSPRPEVVAVSPLTRAMHTAQLAFPSYQSEVRWVAQPDARERLFHSSDIGRPVDELRGDGYHFVDYSLIEEEETWWGGDPYVLKPLEPEESFKGRMVNLTRWLASLDEDCVALVCHWGVLYHLTDRQFANCELMTMRLGDLTTFKDRCCCA